MKTTHYTIGQLAQHAKCKVETVHYYEKSGLLPDPPRTQGGHRMYQLQHMKRLNFIRRSRELGFSIAKIKALLTFIDDPNPSCGEVQSMAILQAQEVQQKIDDLQRLKLALDEMVTQCQQMPYSSHHCPIIDALYVKG